jgi:hypothetical protein
MVNKVPFPVVCLCVAVMTVSLLVSGCGASNTQPANPASPASPAEKKPVLAEKPGEWKADGLIADNEYAKMQSFGEIEVYSRIDGEKVRIALKAKTNGYVAIGFDPSNKMKDADIILGFVKDGKAVVYDMFSPGTTGTHPPKDEQGGKIDVTVFGGSKKDGVTVIEFERLLVTGNPRGKEIKVGDNKIIWSVGSTEDATEKHVTRGSGILKL